MKIVCISDTHNRHKKLTIPECDLLIHAGDWSFQGQYSEVKDFAKWLNKQYDQCSNIVVIPGNHELMFEKNLPFSKTWFTEECPDAHLLIEESVTIDGIKIYGSPIQPFFCNWAWNRYPHEIKKHWDAIPDDTNILITHGPPEGILDQTIYANGDIRPDMLGCPELLRRVKELKHLKLHTFGHIHYFGGKIKQEDGVVFNNASICDEQYIPLNPITVIDLDL